MTSTDPVLPVAVIGGGPAGMSAALWLKQLGLQPLIIEKEPRNGGLQRVSDYPNPFLLGFVGHTANEISEAFERHIAYERIRTLVGEVEHLSAGEDAVRLRVSGRREVLTFSAAVLAMGTRWKKLTVPGADRAEAEGRLRYLGHGSNVEDALGGRVLVVGGGDNAFSAAIELSRYAERVVVACRSTARSQHLLAGELARVKNVELRLHTAVAAIEPGGAQLVGPEGKKESCPAQLVYVTIGFTPNTERLREWLPTLALDPEGYIRVDGDCRTTVPRVWAAGDICNPVHPCTATAVALGTMAARNIEKTLFAAGRLVWELRRF